MARSENYPETRTLVRKAAKAIRLVGFVDYRRYLANLYAWVKKESDSYSYIQFSIDTGLGKSNASRLIITGKRNLSNQHAADIAANMGLRGHQALYFEAMVRYSNARSLVERDEVFADLMHSKSRIEPDALIPEQIAYFDNWLTPVIKELAATKQFNGDTDWIQETINFPLRRDEVKRSLAVLVQLGFLVLNEKTECYEYRAAKAPTLHIDDLAAIRYHQSMIEAGKECLTRLPGNAREVNGCTALLSAESFDELRDHIRKLVDLVDALEKKDVKKSDRDVYQVNFQLFPFTSVNGKS